MSKSDLIKRIADCMALLAAGLILLMVVILLNLGGSVRIVEDVAAVRWLDLVCVAGLIGYGLYRIVDLFKEVKKAR